jgi:hypothetical protein
MIPVDVFTSAVNYGLDHVGNSLTNRIFLRESFIYIESLIINYLISPIEGR